MSFKKIIFPLFFVVLLFFGIFLRIYQTDKILFSSQEENNLKGAIGFAETGNFEVWDFREQKTIKPFKGEKIFTAQMALAVKLFGVSEFSARLPAIFWGIIFLIALFIFCFLITRDYYLSLFILFFGVFANDFVQTSRLALPLTMQLSLFFISLDLVLFKNKFLKILGSLLIIFSIFSIFSFNEIHFINLNNFIKRYKILLSAIFLEFRILWLMFIPLCFYLISEKWWKNKKSLFLVSLFFSLFLVFPILYRIENLNSLFLISLPLFWILALLGIKFLFKKQKIILFCLFIFLVGMMPIIPSKEGFLPITRSFFIDNELAKEEKIKITNLYNFLDNNKLEQTHLISPIDYYLKDYNFSYQKHSSIKKINKNSIIKYTKKSKTGYLIYPKIFNKKWSYNFWHRIHDNFLYHSEISELTGYEVYSWDPERAKKFKEYEL